MIAPLNNQLQNPHPKRPQILLLDRYSQTLLFACEKLLTNTEFGSQRVLKEQTLKYGLTEWNQLAFSPFLSESPITVNNCIQNIRGPSNFEFSCSL